MKMARREAIEKKKKKRRKKEREDAAYSLYTGSIRTFDVGLHHPNEGLQLPQRVKQLLIKDSPVYSQRVGPTQRPSHGLLWSQILVYTHSSVSLLLLFAPGHQAGTSGCYSRRAHVCPFGVRCVNSAWCRSLQVFVAAAVRVLCTERRWGQEH